MSNEPFPFVPSWLDDLGLPTTHFRVLCHLHRRAGKDGRCYPSAPSIATICKIHRNTVWPALAKLEELGLIERMKKSFGGSNAYLLKSPIGTNQGPIESIQSAQSDSRLTDCQSAQSDSRQSALPLCHQSAQSDSREGNPSKEVHLRESKNDIDLGDLLKLEVSTKKPSSDQLAESIYQEYPRKVKKPAGIKAIKNALKTHPAEFLLERVKTYASAIGWQERRFIPHPATWFNEMRWEDDPAEWEQPAPSAPRSGQSNKTAEMDLTRRPSDREEV